MCPRGSTVLGGHADFEVTAAAQRKLAKRHVGPQVSHCDFASAKSQTARTVFAPADRAAAAPTCYGGRRITGSSRYPIRIKQALGCARRTVDDV